MLPLYVAEAWREDEWWVARLVTGGETFGRTTQAETREGVAPMVRDLVATLLDRDESTFVVEVRYTPQSWLTLD